MKWEYKTIKTDTKGAFGGYFEHHKFERLMNELGQQGWELVSALHTTRELGASRHVIAILKRPLE